MATEETIKRVVYMLFQSPLANKPKPLPGQTETDVITATMRIYALTLQDIEDSLLQAAVINHLANEKWFPAVADIRSSALSLVNRADDTPSSFEAWSEVKLAIRRYGSWSVPELEPMTAQVVNLLGGFKEFCMMASDDEPSWRARFIQAYEQLQSRQAQEAMTPPAIAGYIQQRRELNGSSVSGLIGEAAKRLKAGD